MSSLFSILIFVFTNFVMLNVRKPHLQCLLNLDKGSKERRSTLIPVVENALNNFPRLSGQIACAVCVVREEVVVQNLTSQVF